MLQLTLEFYLKSLLITVLLVFAISVLYLLGYMARGQNIPSHERRERMFDVVLVDLLTIPILSFATCAIILVFRT
jgi:hypothetical protein